eukprot:UN14246
MSISLPPIFDPRSPNFSKLICDLYIINEFGRTFVAMANFNKILNIYQDMIATNLIDNTFFLMMIPQLCQPWNHIIQM